MVPRFFFLCVSMCACARVRASAFVYVCRRRYKCVENKSLALSVFHGFSPSYFLRQSPSKNLELNNCPDWPASKPQNLPLYAPPSPALGLQTTNSGSRPSQQYLQMERAPQPRVTHFLNVLRIHEPTCCTIGMENYLRKKIFN